MERSAKRLSAFVVHTSSAPSRVSVYGWVKKYWLFRPAWQAVASGGSVGRGGDSSGAASCSTTVKRPCFGLLHSPTGASAQLTTMWVDQNAPENSKWLDGDLREREREREKERENISIRTHSRTHTQRVSILSLSLSLSLSHTHTHTHFLHSAVIIL